MPKRRCSPPPGWAYLVGRDIDTCLFAQLAYRCLGRSSHLPRSHRRAAPTSSGARASRVPGCGRGAPYRARPGRPSGRRYARSPGDRQEAWSYWSVNHCATSIATCSVRDGRTNQNGAPPGVPVSRTCNGATGPLIAGQMHRARRGIPYGDGHTRVSSHLSVARSAVLMPSVLALVGRPDRRWSGRR